MILFKHTLLILVLSLMACSESKFKGTNASNGQEQNQVQNELPAQSQPGCDLTQDFIRLENLPPDIQECENNGGFYFYVDNKCYNYSAPKTECTLESIKSILTSYKIPTQTIDDAISRNAKILDCRQFPEVRTIAVNWWFVDPNQTDCKYTESLNRSTACYRVLPPGETSSGDHLEKARSCLNSL